jgi:hypothetical protein
MMNLSDLPINGMINVVKIKVQHKRVEAKLV